MPLATRMPGPAIQAAHSAAQAVVPAGVDSEIEVVAEASEAGPSSLHEKTLPKPGEAVHAAGAQTPASMLSAVAKLGATSVLTQTADDRQTKLERKKSTLYGFHAHTEHTKGRAGRVSFAGRRSSAGAALQEAASSHNCSAAPSGIGRMPAAPALPAARPLPMPNLAPATGRVAPTAPWDAHSTLAAAAVAMDRLPEGGSIHKILLDLIPSPIYVRSADGRGPLWWAYSSGQKQIRKLLTKSGCQKDLVDKDGLSPKDIKKTKKK